MIDELKKNIDTEIEMLGEIAHYSALLANTSPNERYLLQTSLDSLQNSLKLIHNSIPSIVKNLSAMQKLPSDAAPSLKPKLEQVTYSGDISMSVVLRPEDKEKFFRELSIREEFLKKVKTGFRKSRGEKEEFFQRSRGYVKLANRLFMPFASRLIEEGRFKQLAVEVRKANFNILLESYISIIFFTCAISFILSLFVVLFFSFFETDLITFTLTLSKNPLSRLIKILIIPFAVPLAVFGAMYFYPSTEKSTIAKRIEQELPFAVIHMSAVAGSGIEPTNIFRIVALSREYPHLRKEIRKVLNQINLYGYDLVTALTTVSKTTPSARVSELFSGLSTTINSGGSLSEFFEKRAETLMMNYRLEREKFTNTAETFMDIYITVAIAAPMILLLILIMLSLSNFAVGMPPWMFTLIIILILGVINVAFLMLLHLKQPTY